MALPAGKQRSAKHCWILQAKDRSLAHQGQEALQVPVQDSCLILPCLALQNNNFSGGLPEALLQARQLLMLDVSDNPLVNVSCCCGRPGMRNAAHRAVDSLCRRPMQQDTQC